MQKSSFARGEFMEFMDAYLKAHPEVVEDQKRGWGIHWTPRQSGKDELGDENAEDTLAEEMRP